MTLIGVMIFVGSGLNLRSEAGAGILVAVDGRVVLVAFDADVFEVTRRFVTIAGVVVSEAY